MLEKIFGPYRDYAFLVLRAFLGMLFLTYGTLKFLGGVQGFAGYLAQHGVPLPGLMAPIVMAIEFFGGLAIILGTSTRLAALLLSGLMVVAMLTVTLKVGFAGGYDINLACLGGLLALLLAGPGKVAVGGDL
ncbi:MAG: DoxX family protein [Alphaproteobacteria bacterium]